MPDHDNSWKQQANCLNIDPELFFPTKDSKASDTVHAKKVCEGCEIRERCLEYAIDNREKFGIWGGKTWTERRAIIKRRATEARLLAV